MNYTAFGSFQNSKSTNSLLNTRIVENFNFSLQAIKTDKDIKTDNVADLEINNNLKQEIKGLQIELDKNKSINIYLTRKKILNTNNMNINDKIDYEKKITMLSNKMDKLILENETIVLENKNIANLQKKSYSLEQPITLNNKIFTLLQQNNNIPVDYNINKPQLLNTNLKLNGNYIRVNIKQLNSSNNHELNYSRNNFSSNEN